MKIAVVGAGFSGLVTSYFLVKRGFEVEIFECQPRVGGLIDTIETEYGKVETAANGLLNCAQLEELCSDIGVTLQKTRSEARNRFIFRKGEPKRWPLTVFESIRVGWFVFRYVFFKSRVAPQEGESISEWGTRVLGSSASKYSIETAVLGIYGSDAKNLSASLILKRLFSGRSRSPKILKLGNGTVAPIEGMGALIKGLTNYLTSRNVKIHLDIEITSPQQLPPSNYLVIATSVSKAAELLNACGDSRGKVLDEISTLPITSTTVFTKSPERRKLKGFGILFPQVDNNFALGVLFNNFIFANRAYDCESDTWITAGAEVRDQLLIESIVAEREKIFHRPAEVLDYRVNRWAKALPCYDMQLEKSLKDLKVISGRICLIGNYLGEIGLKQILLRAEKLSNDLSEKLA